ncbi:MAG: hypothetical protein ACI9FN_003979 [Saprospiraceae bacterium]|jgi:hypothetical protein
MDGIIKRIKDPIQDSINSWYNSIIDESKAKRYFNLPDVLISTKYLWGSERG